VNEKHSQRFVGRVDLGSFILQQHGELGLKLQML